MQVWRWLPTSWISAVFCRISAAYTEVLSSQKWGQRPCANCCRRLGVGTCPVLYIVMVMSAWPWLWCGHYFRTIVRVHPVYMTKMWLSILRLLIDCESACSLLMSTATIAIYYYLSYFYNVWLWLALYLVNWPTVVLQCLTLLVGSSDP